MTRRLFLQGMLLFALLFQSMAQVMPCCAIMDELQTQTSLTAVMDDLAQHAEEGCFAGSPACCVIPSLARKADIPVAQNLSPVHIPTVITLRITQLQTPPDRPPRA
jgi:hypothetical protein